MQKFRHLLGVCLLLAATTASQAQMGPEPEQRPVKKDYTAPERKTVGWFFNKPSRTNAADQFAFAEELLATNKPGKASSAYNALVCAWPQSPEAPKAQLKHALLLEEDRNYDDAFDEFQYLIHYYSGSFDHNDVLRHQFQIANMTRMGRRMTLGIFPGFAAPERAIPLFERIVANGPSWTNAPEAQFTIGMIHEDLEEYDDAISAYDRAQNRYPDSAFAPEASFRRAHCFYRLAKKTPRNETSIKDAMSALTSFISTYKNNPNMEDARKYFGEMRDLMAEKYYDQAVFYDKGDFSAKAAIVAYGDFIKKFPDTKKADLAQKRIEALRAKMEQQQ